jgi:hypothetical protein
MTAATVSDDTQVVGPDDTPMVARGLAYAARGWPVFPVSALTKKPLIKDWPNRATTDPKVIRATWRKSPKAGIGIVTGSRSKLVVVDLDVKNDKDGPGNWDNYLQSKGADLPQTWTVRTRSGGEHRYYRVPESADYTNSAGVVAEGVDVRGTGGYVVAPPTPGYEFLAELDGSVLPELPVGVLPEKGSPGRSTGTREKRNPQYARAAFASGLADIALSMEGQRNDTLFKVAVRAAEFVADNLLDEEEVREALWEKAVQSGLDTDEIEQTVDSAFAKVAREAPCPSDALSGPWRGPYVRTDDLLWAEDSVRPSIWGPPESPLWMPGESLMIAGESGLGKSTLAQSLVAARLGLRDEVMGYPVADDGGKVLYLALDRSAQIRRMMRRQVPDDPRIRQVARDRLVIREGPLPVLLTDERNDGWLLEQAQAVGATTVVIDSLKNVVLKPSDEASANAYDRARQALMTAGINLIEIHHTRKTTTQGQGGRGGMDDVHGSFALVAGAGSVLTLSKPKGADESSSEVWLRQVKSLTGTHKGVMLSLDREAGLLDRVDVAESLENQISALFFWRNEDGTPKKLLPREIYPQLYPEGATTTQQSNVRKKLSQFVRTGELAKDGEGRYMAKTSS